MLAVRAAGRWSIARCSAAAPWVRRIPPPDNALPIDLPIDAKLAAGVSAFVRVLRRPQAAGQPTTTRRSRSQRVVTGPTTARAWFTIGRTSALVSARDWGRLGLAGAPGQPAAFRLRCPPQGRPTARDRLRSPGQDETLHYTGVQLRRPLAPSLVSGPCPLTRLGARPRPSR